MIRFKYLYKDDLSWNDTEFLRIVRSHPVTLNNVLHKKKITRIEQEEWFTQVYSRQRDYHIWIAYDDKKSAPFGYIQVFADSIIHRRVQLNWVPSPEILTFNAYTALVKGSLKQLGKLEMDVHKVWAYVFPENELLVGVLGELGFEVDANLREHSYSDGVYRDVLVISKIVDISM